MTINKAHLIDHLYRNSNFSRDESSATIEALLEIIKHTLESGENLLISGFGKFIVKEKNLAVEETLQLETISPWMPEES